MKVKCHYLSEIVCKVIIATFMLSFIAYGNDYLLLFLTMFMNAYCIYKCRYNNMLFLIMAFILFSNYSIFAYFWFELFGVPIKNSYINWLQHPDIINTGLIILYVFSLILFIAVPKSQKNKINIFFSSENPKRNSFMSIVLLSGILIVILWSIYSTYKSGVYIERSIYEYTTILYIIALYHAGKHRNIKYMIIGVMLIDILFVLTNGDRGHAIQLLLVIYCIFMQYKIPKALLFLALIIGIIGLNAIGMWRGNGFFSPQMLSASFTSLVSRGFVLDTAYAAEGSGLAMVYLSNIYSLKDRLYLFVIYICSIFLGSRAFSTDADLSSIVIEEKLYASGGGVLPNYGYFYLGYLGVFLLGSLVCLYINMMSRNNTLSSGMKKCIAVYLFANITRWYLYSPAPLLRGVILLILVYEFSIHIRIKLK